MDYFELFKLTAFKNLCDIANDFKKKLDTVINTNNNLTGILSGFEGLDAITKGFQPSNLILIGGAPGMGKTSFAISLIRKMALENKIPTAFFSLQMNANQIMTSIISQETNIVYEKLRLGDLDENDRQVISEKLKWLNYHCLDISDYPFRTITEIENELSFQPPDYAKVLIIDPLDCISKTKKDKTEKVLNKKEITQIACRLKKIAEKYNVVVIAFFDIKNKKHNNKRPTLLQVRKKAPIDTYADLVLLLYRPEYYKIDEWDGDEEDPTAGQAEIVIAKNNHGFLKNIRIQFNGDKKGFDNLNN